ERSERSERPEWSERPERSELVRFDREILAEWCPGTAAAECAELTPEHAPRQDQRGHAQRGAAGHEGDDDDVPQRPVVVEPREVEGVQAVIQPALHPVLRAV